MEVEGEQEEYCDKISHEEEESYAQRRILVLVMWYLPIVKRLCCLFRNHEDAKLMSWHASNKRKKDNCKLQHGADSRYGKHFDATYR